MLEQIIVQYFYKKLRNKISTKPTQILNSIIIVANFTQSLDLQ